MPATAWPLFFMFPLTRTSRHLKLLLKYIQINENACLGVAKFGTITSSAHADHIAAAHQLEVS